MHTLIWFSIIFIVNLYIFARGWQAIPRKWFFMLIYAICFFGVALFFFLGLLNSGRFPINLSFTLDYFNPSIKQLAGYGIVFFAVFLNAAFLADIVRIVFYLLKRRPDWVHKHYQQIKHAYFLFVIAFAFIISVIGYNQAKNTRLTELSIKIDKSLNNYDGLKIVAVSDLHLGNMVTIDDLSRWVNIINDQNADLILLVGDINDWNFDTNCTHVIENELLKLNSEIGVFAVIGNHDFCFSTEKTSQMLQRANINILHDTTVVINNSFALVGRDDDANNRRKILDTLLNGLDPSLPIILMDHQPVNLDETISKGVDLQISGHTHNGQVFPINVIFSKIWNLSYGYQKTNNTHFYVTSGLGVTVVPIRLGTRSEIVCIRLNK